MATFVLIHGSTLGGWSWRWVAPLLRAAGHDVYTPTLTGLGERVHLATPEVDPNTHFADIVNLLYYEDLWDVVLVGWSYGGTVIPGVADRAPERIAQLVYLDADVPRNGETSSPPAYHAAKTAQAREHGDGWRIPPSSNADDMPSELSAEGRRWMVERLTPDLLNTRIQPIRLANPTAAIPTTYIRCTRDYDPASPINQQEDARIRSEPAWRYMELDAGHAAPLAHPQAVADLLLEIGAAPRTASDPAG